ncbi:MAG: phosphodiester glycosidase family protein [Paludibacter sp.]|nr:phosphodiester glycosidase family protein [Paludibacter sp.]
MFKKYILLLVVSIFVWTCENKTPDYNEYDFPETDSSGINVNAKYPKGLTVDTTILNLGTNSSAFIVTATIDFTKNSKLRFNPVHSTTASKPSVHLHNFSSANQKPYIAINGGYFWQGASLSLLISNGVVKSIENQSVTRDGKTVYPVRSSFGQMENGSFETTWIYCVTDDGNKPYSFPSALGNDERTKIYMATPPTSKTAGATKWLAKNSIGGGPMLIKDSINVAVENYWKEVFDGGGIAGTSRQPRTAIGVTGKGRLVLVVVDGRNSNGSVGITLAELANFMMTLGVKHAINVDGGGSSVMVGPEGLLTKPSDSGNVERSVPTSVIISEQQ